MMKLPASNYLRVNIIVFLLFTVFLFAACDFFVGKPEQAQLQNIFAPDTLLTPTGKAQLDSLLQLAAVAKPDTNLVSLYIDIGSIYGNIVFEKGTEYFLKVKQLSEQLDWNVGRYYYAMCHAAILSREQLPDSALVLLQQALELSRREKDENYEVMLLFNMGSTYFMKGWDETALDYLLEALPFFKRRNDNYYIRSTYFILAQIYNSLNSTEKAIEYSEKYLTLDSENPDAYIILGQAYANAKQYEKGNGYLEEALRLSKLQNNQFYIARIYSLLSNVALCVFDLDRSEKYALLSLEINQQFGCYACHTDFVILSKIEMAKGNFGKAEEYINEAMQYISEVENFNFKKICNLILTQLAVVKGNYREYIDLGNEFDLLEIAFAQQTTLIAAEEMAAKYETEKKELEIERQKQVIARQNLQRWLLTLGVAVSIIFLALLWYMLRLRNRRNSALADMNATKDKFFSIISHDLKNPAIAQRDAIQMLVKNARLWDANTLTGYYNELLKSADEEVELIYNLLGWAQVQTGRMSYTPETILLSDILPNISLIRKAAEKKGVTLDVQIPKDALITCDSNMLATVIRNLLNNAVKFTAKGGSVALEISNCSSTYIVSVSDTGVGMNKEQLQNLFCLDNLHSRRGTAGETGSGLGLIVCKELLEKHGSKLNVESEEGKGSRFWFEVF